MRRLPGFDAKVLSLYARGLTVRELQAHLEECYQVEISPAVITAVTEAIFAWGGPDAGPTAARQMSLKRRDCLPARGRGLPPLRSPTGPLSTFAERGRRMRFSVLQQQFDHLAEAALQLNEGERQYPRRGPGAVHFPGVYAVDV